MKNTDFELNDQDGKLVRLSDFGKKMKLIYFYPKDDTPGCTTEACSLRDNYHRLEALGVQIVGISKDSVESHKKFSQKYKLNFPILSDPEHKVIEAYGAWGMKKFMGKEFEGIIRKSFLLDGENNIVKAYDKVNPLTHAGEIIDDLEKLKS